jgi:hypothetical protein
MVCVGRFSWATACVERELGRKYKIIIIIIIIITIANIYYQAEIMNMYNL